MKDLAPKILDGEFKDVLDQLENTKEHYFITGRAGSGKSTLLALFKKTTKKRAVIVAPTGIAALNVGGQTIHSFFGFPPKMLHPKDITKRRNHYLYRNLDVLIIDEISMVRADMLDNIDLFLRINRDADIPFGGVQLICFGDLFQLPPVVSTGFERQYFKTSYGSPYFFSSKVIEHQIDLKMIELQKVYRQTEKFFVKLLDRIRIRTFDEDDVIMLNQQVGHQQDEGDMFITLCTINSTANAVNHKKLNEIPSYSHFFQASITGNFKASVFPTAEVLELKEGAQVMFVKNDPNKRFVNGTIGRIIKIGEGVINVLIKKENAEEIIQVEKMDWEIIRYKLDEKNINRFKTETVGTFTQYPLKLAWAITIHKSQGKTFDQIKIDLGRGAFEYGQTYVALSRCRTLNGIVLQNPIKPSDILVDPRIIDFYETKSRYW